jgi:hypothetical protein
VQQPPQIVSLNRHAGSGSQIAEQDERNMLQMLRGDSLVGYLDAVTKMKTS